MQSAENLIQAFFRYLQESQHNPLLGLTDPTPPAPVPVPVVIPSTYTPAAGIPSAAGFKTWADYWASASQKLNIPPPADFTPAEPANAQLVAQLQEEWRLNPESGHNKDLSV